ncbi:translation protein [Rhypophila decipiens]|uniref:Large ribosomal subunit protein uL3m n=1 Tax=Rhypophila decipiens TaxID=261697 RepID=A0AAN7BAK2_9PEZI|nr:translation protein [Rhypophila decipiens]
MAPRLPARCCWRQLSLAGASTPRTALIFAPQIQKSSFSKTAISPVKYGWSTTLPKRGAKPYKYDQTTSGLPALTTGPAAALERRKNTTPVRAGVIAVKKGMTAFFGNRGARIPCTVLQLDQVQALANKTREKNGYFAVQVGFGDRKADNVGAPMLGWYEAKGIPPKEKVAEFKVRDESGLLPPGVQLQPDWFHVGQWVDVRADCKGKGFAGGMKRHGFAGQEASHGNSKNHRTIGSSGPSQGSGSRVLPGKKMPGRMGGQRVTVQNLPVLMVNNELGIVVVKGCVAGPKGAHVLIQDAVKKPPPPQEFIQKTRKLLDQRFPNAEEYLEAARKQHLVLKEARAQGRIDQMLKKGVTATDEIESLLQARITAPEVVA